MKVLLCSITVGEGLNTMCKAISNELNALEIENEVFNVFENYKEQEKFNSATYYKMAKYIPNLLKFFQRRYGQYNRNLNKLKNYKLINKEVKILSDVLPEKIKQGGFDVIYTPVASVAVSAMKLKREGKINCKVIYNIPDFNIPTCMELCNGIDAIITPCEEVENNLLTANFKKEIMHQETFPFNSKFLNKLNKSDIKKNMGIPLDKFTVLIVSGGAGYGKTSKIIKTFIKNTKNLQFIIVNGKNAIEKQKIDLFIEKKDLKNIINLGFCTNMDELMTVSDVIYSKTGAATMCEAFAKNLLIVLSKQRLYPECDNLRHLKKHKAAIQCNNDKACAKVFMELKNNKINFEKMKNNFQSLFKSDSTKRITDIIINI